MHSSCVPLKASNYKCGCLGSMSLDVQSLNSSWFNCSQRSTSSSSSYSNFPTVTLWCQKHVPRQISQRTLLANDETALKINNHENKHLFRAGSSCIQPANTHQEQIQAYVIMLFSETGACFSEFKFNIQILHSRMPDYLGQRCKANSLASC